MAEPVDGPSAPSTPPTNPASGQATGGSRTAPAKEPTGKGVAPAATTSTAAKKPAAGNLANLDRAVRDGLNRLNYDFDQFEAALTDHTNGSNDRLIAANHRTVMDRKKFVAGVEADLRARVTGSASSLEDAGKRLTDLMSDAGTKGNEELKEELKYAVEVAFVDLKAERRPQDIRALAAAMVRDAKPSIQITIVREDGTTDGDDVINPLIKLMALDRSYPSYNDALKHEVQIDPGYGRNIRKAAEDCYQNPDDDKVFSEIHRRMAYIIEPDIRKDFIDAVKDYAINNEKIGVLKKLHPLWMSVMNEKP